MNTATYEHEGVSVVKKDFPSIHFYDQGFVDIYDQTWAWIQDYWTKGTTKNKLQTRFFNDPEAPTINQFESCMSTFFLVYSNRNFPCAPQLDNFYNKQEASGAIRADYSTSTGKPVFTDENPEGVNPPLFSWAEHNLYHKVGNKKRIKEVLPKLEAHFTWLETTFRHENGLYCVPAAATMMPNAPRGDAVYFADFNAQQALNALYLAELGEILNDKDISFRYRRQFFALKTKINQLMWNEEAGFYFDLDANGNQVEFKLIGAYWSLLAEIPNDARADKMIAHLKNPKTFGTEHPFPTLAADEATFDECGSACRGSVYPPFTFMVVKALEKFGSYELAREASIRHLYYMLDTLHPESKGKGSVWEAYAPTKDGPAQWPENPTFPRKQFLHYVGLSTVALMIENVIGLYISLPKKTVDWIVPTVEVMGIENLSLKRNMITILFNKTGRGWEIRLESEKLYYFTVNVLGSQAKKKTLPIPSGKCSMLLDKL